jgi:hypothetical protein
MSAFKGVSEAVESVIGKDAMGYVTEQADALGLGDEMK